jgi:glycosyltransferase involved in cell wall biosynthesis
MDRKKLCLLIPSLSAGGMERVMSQLAFFFCQKDDLEMHLVLYGKDTEIFYEIPESLIIHYPKMRFNDKIRIISTLNRLCFLRRVVRIIKPDNILSFGEYWNSFVLLSLFGLPYPVYVSDRCQPDKPLGKMHAILRKWLYPRTKGIIAQTTKAKEVYEKQFRHNNIRVIGNPVRIVNDSLKPTMNENIVLTVGRLINSKNHDKLIELFVKINLPGWKLIIIGGNAQKQDNMTRLQALIKKLDAENIVILEGYHLNVEQFYLKSKIFAFTSESEGFPNVIAEAQSYGLPVIAFDCVAGPSDLIIDNHNGFLIPLSDYNLFFEKLRLLMECPELRDKFSTNAKEFVKEFSIDNIGEKYYNFIFCDK